MAAKNKSNEIRITRLYDAPVKTVWDAWTDPKQAAHWWGPRGFSITTHSKELKPGGHWHYTMHGPDGTDYPNKTIYLEVEKYAKLVYDHGGNNERAPLFRVTVLFSEQGGKTLMDMCMTLPTPEAAAETKDFIRKAGGNATWDRLAEYLEEIRSSKHLFVINRSFDAPRDDMFALWTDPVHLGRWLPPTGFTMEFIRVDIRTGGESFYCMSNAAGLRMFGKIAYLAITKPRHIMYTQCFCQEDESIARHPMAPTWPETMLTKVEFHAEGPETTRVTVTWQPEGNVSAEEMATFLQGRSGMTQGWTGSFDKLDDYIASRTAQPLRRTGSH